MSAASSCLASLRVSDLPHSDKIKYLTAEDATVAHVVSIREEVVAAPAEGEAVAAVEGAAAPGEPEVAKKGKTEPEGGAKKALTLERRSKQWPKKASPADRKVLCPVKFVGSFSGGGAWQSGTRVSVDAA